MNSTHPISDYLERKGKSLTQLAKDSNCSRMTLYRLIAGEQNATIGLLKRISLATEGEVPVSALVGKDDLQAAE